MDVQVAEQSAECQVLVRRDVLIAEEEDAILGQRAMDLVLLAVRERLAEIDAELKVVTDRILTMIGRLSQ